MKTGVHQVSGRRGLGLLLAVLTVVLWGSTNVVLELVLREIDPYTVSCFRFLLASSLLLPFIARRYGLPGREQLRGKIFGMVIGASIFLCLNYALFMFGLSIILPGATVVLMQLAPAFMLLGGVLIFHESFNRRQFAGLIFLLTGLALFFHDRLGLVFTSGGHYGVGVVLVILAALAWAAYALTQKQLLNHFSSGTIMFMIYGAGFCFFLPLSHPGTLLELKGFTLILLIYTGFNTLVAYGSFAESLEHLEASRVSAILATLPLWVIFFVKATNHLFPGVLEPEPLNAPALIGAVLVAAGSMVSALSGIKPPQDQSPNPPAAN